MSKITFTREALDNYKSKCEIGIKKGHDTFVWKGSLVNINDAKVLIKKLENSRDLSIPYTY